jgi:hypothetical protein
MTDTFTALFAALVLILAAAQLPHMAAKGLAELEMMK